jgi:arylsulfatase A-like enzyme
MDFLRGRSERLWLGLFVMALLLVSALFFALSYRILLLSELKLIYPDLSLGLGALIRHSALTDALVALCVALPGALFFRTLSRRAEKLTVMAIVLLLLFYGGLLAGALLFVTIFESPFQTSFFGQSLGTFKSAMVTSTLSELSLIPFRKAIPILIVAVIAAGGFIYAVLVRGYTLGRIFSGTILALFAIFFLLGATAPAAPVSGGKGARFEFHSVFSNPLSHLMAHILSKKTPAALTPPSEAAAPVSDKAASPLARYNTDSKAFNKLYPRIPFERGTGLNVVLYFMESTSAAYMNLKYKGRDVMPNLRALSERGFNGEHHYANFPLSINTFYTVLTSAYQYPDKNFIPCSQPHIPVESIYETLKGAGYRTAVFHGSGLDNFCRRDYLRHRKVDVQIGFEELDHRGYPPIDPTWQADDRVMLKPFVKFLNEKPGTPAFAVVMPISPHHPYLVPDEKFNITKEELATDSGRKQQYWLQYINSLHFSDYVLGEFMAELERNHLAKNTVVFIFGDHGEAFYQHPGNYLHSLYVYEENVRVPFVIVNPGLFPSKIRYEGISRMIDIAPTVLDIAGIKPPRHYQGVSLLSAHPQQMALFHAQWADDIVGVVDGHVKYIYRFDDGFEELFDLRADPEEKINTASTSPRLAEKYRKLLLDSRQHSRSFYSAVNSLKQ